MYWAKNEDGTYELLDGQQRTVSICRYLNGDYSIDNQYFHSLPADIKEKIEEYELHIYVVEGEPSEKLEWFRIVNIAGEPLYDQELLNAQYTGQWLADAKRLFSKTGCPAYQIGSDYLSGSTIRQDYLETALRWISNGDIEEYMSAHHHVPNASELWEHFQAIVNWVEATFPVYRREMKGLDWGRLYSNHKDDKVDPAKTERLISELYADEEVKKKSGIYEYVLTKDERHLNLRSFTPSQKATLYEQQAGVCPMCEEQFEIAQMHADHITPWSEGGKTEIENGQMLCADCNRRKSNR
jgi:5-methylcytosine-specific restriction endonuclease McrA